MSVPKLSKKYNIHVQSFYTAFKRLDLPVIPKPHDKGTDYNHQFFNEIDSELKAYLLGWLMSDGYVTSRDRVGIKLNKQDIEIIELFKNSIAPNITITNDGDGRCVQFSSKELHNAAIKCGILPNKTYCQLHIPDIKNDLKRHFIRGYFDGDGSITIRTRNRVIWYICSIDYTILKEFMDELNLYNIKTTIYTENRDHLGYKTMYKLQISGLKSNKLLAFNYFYNNCNYYLTRKFIKLNNLYGNTEVSTETKESVTP